MHAEQFLVDEKRRGILKTANLTDLTPPFYLNVAVCMFMDISVSLCDHYLISQLFTLFLL